MTNKALFWSFYVIFCTFCASLRLIKHLFSWLLNKAVSMALWTKASLCVKSSLLEQSLPRTPSRPKTSAISASKNLCNLLLKICEICGKNLRNLRLINDLRSTKDYVRKNKLFMQNKANFRKVKFDVNRVLTKDYDRMDTWSIRKNKPKTKPNKAKTNPNKAKLKKAKMNVTSIITKGYENKSNWAICENEPKTKPIQTRRRALAGQFKLADELRLKPQWKSGGDLSQLKPKTVKLRFTLKNARLYSFSFTHISHVNRDKRTEF